MDIVFFIVLLLLMMEVLPSSSRYTTASFRHRHKKRTPALCVGGKWFQVGSFRFWQRSSCVKRRQAKMQPPAIRPIKAVGEPVMGTLNRDKQYETPKPSWIDFDLIIPSAEDGPKRNSSYDPNYGHEPYWANGDWVFDKNPYIKDGYDRGDKDVDMCGNQCPPVYKEYGQVCGKNKRDKYETFSSICALRNVDCSNKDKWYLVYKGPCLDNLGTIARQDIYKKTNDAIKRLLEVLSTREKYVGFCEKCKNP